MKQIPVPAGSFRADKLSHSPGASVLKLEVPAASDPTEIALHRHVAGKQITRIVGLRVTGNNTYLLDRLDWIGHDSTAAKVSDVLIVDDGSAAPYSNIIQDVCRRAGLRYLRLETEHKLFSIARCRNAGAMNAVTRYVLMMDCDILVPEGFFEKLAREIEILQLPKRAEDFIMIPAAYLTREATEEYLGNQGWLKMHEYLHHIIERDPTRIEKYSSGTSTCLYDRIYYLSRGGNSEEFCGWGYEDLEFNLRAIRHSKLFPLPSEFGRDISSFDSQFEYRGWKSVYRLFGDRSFLKGLVTFHAWHPIDDASAYRRKRVGNAAMLKKKIADHAGADNEPEPLPDLSRGTSLVLKKNAFTFSRTFRPLLGNVIQLTADEMPSDANMAEFLSRRSIDRIIFHNPYASEETRRIYNWARREGFPFVICERGALTGSVFFDPTGFLADSKMFQPKYWDAPLSDEERQLVVDYVQSATASNAALEAQGTRLGGDTLRTNNGIGRSDRLVVVCLQRPSDTATKWFSGPLGTYGDYLMMLEDISKRLPYDVKLAFRLHPLEDEKPGNLGIDLSNYHINDVFEAASALVVFTSGVGVQAMLWRVPVIVCGNAFYRHSQLNFAADTKSDLMRLMCSPLSFNEEASYRFLHYLISKYYSFGELLTRSVRLDDGSRMTATTDIRFSALRAFDDVELHFACRAQPEDSWRSMLFDRYVGLGQTSAFTTEPASAGNAHRRPQRTREKVGLAKSIYRRSRGVPVFEQILDVIAPIYDRVVGTSNR